VLKEFGFRFEHEARAQCIMSWDVYNRCFLPV